MARSTPRSQRRARAGQGAVGASSRRAGAGQGAGGAVAAPRPPAGASGTGGVASGANRSTRPRSSVPRTTSRGLDPRWLIGGATLAVVLVVLAVTYFSGSLGGSGGGAAGAPVGQVTAEAAAGTAPAMLSAGTPAPDLSWTLNGAPGSLSAEKGHPVLLAFVATWCPHCQAEVAVLNTIQDRFAAQGLEVIGVSASPMGMDGRSRASLGDMELFVRRHNARYPHLFDAGLVGAQRYGVRSFPTLYVIDGTGTIRYAQSGEVGEEELARAVQAALTPAA